MKYRITIEPEPVTEFESLEDLRRWLEQQRAKPFTPPKPFPFDETYSTPTQFTNWLETYR